MGIRRAVAVAVTAFITAAVLPLAAAPPASAGSCASAAGITHGISGTMASVNGNVSVGLGYSWMTITNTVTSVIRCGVDTPTLAERFYVRVVTTDVQGGGNPALVTQSIRLPAGLYPAIDASNPIICETRRLSDNYRDNPTTPCPGLTLDTTTGAGWNQSFPYYGSTTYALGQSYLPAGWSLVTAIPVVATTAFAGIGGASSTFAWGGARVDWIGIGGTGYAYSSAPFYVNDRAPTVGYPVSPVLSLGSTGATVRAEIANYWKAGTAWIQYGTTTGYGSTTPADTIPGNDPSYPGYYSDFTLSGLSAGRTYHWRAVFRTTAGATYYGADRTLTTPGSQATVPGAPGKPSGTAGNGQVALAWGAPSSDGGRTITGYKVERSSGSGWTTAIANTGTSTRSATVTGLTNGTSYTFRVSAINSIGTGTASVASDPVTPAAAATAPGAPGKPSGTAGNGQVALTWGAPSSDGGRTITGYKVERSSGSGWTTAIANTGTSTRSATVTGLTNGTSYTFRVSAINSIGTGTASVASNPVTPTAPDTSPPIVTTSAMPAVSSSTALTFTYGASDAGSGVASYSVRWARTPAGGGTQAPWVYPPTANTTTAVSFTLTGQPGYRHCFSVAAKDKAGNTSPWSTPRCSVVPFDDASLTASAAGWTRGTASGWIAGTFTTGSRNGASLTRSTSTGVMQAGVIATTCPTCGSVAVYMGSQNVGTISLVSSSTVTRALKLLPRFAAKKTGAVKVVVTSATGKLVKLDALATTAW